MDISHTRLSYVAKKEHISKFIITFLFSMLFSAFSSAGEENINFGVSVNLSKTQLVNLDYTIQPILEARDTMPSLPSLISALKTNIQRNSNSQQSTSNSQKFIVIVPKDISKYRTIGAYKPNNEYIFAPLFHTSKNNIFNNVGADLLQVPDNELYPSEYAGSAISTVNAHPLQLRAGLSNILPHGQKTLQNFATADSQDLNIIYFVDQTPGSETQLKASDLALIAEQDKELLECTEETTNIDQFFSDKSTTPVTIRTFFLTPTACWIKQDHKQFQENLNYELNQNKKATAVSLSKDMDTQAGLTTRTVQTTSSTPQQIQAMPSSQPGFAIPFYLPYTGVTEIAQALEITRAISLLQHKFPNKSVGINFASNENESDTFRLQFNQDPKNAKIPSLGTNQATVIYHLLNLIKNKPQQTGCDINRLRIYPTSSLTRSSKDLDQLADKEADYLYNDLKQGNILLIWHNEKTLNQTIISGPIPRIELAIGGGVATVTRSILYARWKHASVMVQFPIPSQDVGLISSINNIPERKLKTLSSDTLKFMSGPCQLHQNNYYQALLNGNPKPIQPQNTGQKGNITPKSTVATTKAEAVINSTTNIKTLPLSPDHPNSQTKKIQQPIPINVLEPTLGATKPPTETEKSGLATRPVNFPGVFDSIYIPKIPNTKEQAKFRAYESDLTVIIKNMITACLKDRPVNDTSNIIFVLPNTEKESSKEYNSLLANLAGQEVTPLDLSELIYSRETNAIHKACSEVSKLNPELANKVKVLPINPNKLPLNIDKTVVNHVTNGDVVLVLQDDKSDAASGTKLLTKFRSTFPNNYLGQLLCALQPSRQALNTSTSGVRQVWVPIPDSKKLVSASNPANTLVKDVETNISTKTEIVLTCTTNERWYNAINQYNTSSGFTQLLDQYNAHKPTSPHLQLILSAAQKLHDKGYSVTIHPFDSTKVRQPSFMSLIDKFFTNLEQTLNTTKETCIVLLNNQCHPYVIIGGGQNQLNPQHQNRVNHLAQNLLNKYQWVPLQPDDSVAISDNVQNGDFPCSLTMKGKSMPASVAISDNVQNGNIPCSITMGGQSIPAEAVSFLGPYGDNRQFWKVPHAKLKIIAQNLDTCPICLCAPQDGDDLYFSSACHPNGCQGMVCSDCFDNVKESMDVCSICSVAFGIRKGMEIPGASVYVSHEPYDSLPGEEGKGRIVLHYSIPEGTQQESLKHPTPGKKYDGINRSGYLSDSPKGVEVAIRLLIAFNRNLVFTIGDSVTTGKKGVITWNEIHHKTTTAYNAAFGYPDKTYLNRVSDELDGKSVFLDKITDDEKSYIQSIDSNLYEIYKGLRNK